MLSVKGITYQVGKKSILNGITTEFSKGQFHVIVGPNGSGKSTFLKIFSGELKPSSGEVIYDDEVIHTTQKLKLAKKRAVMSQQPELHFPLAVSEVVMMGRYPHFNFKPSSTDIAICKEAMQKTEVEEFADRNYLTLSGGEQQRVQFARVLSQIWETNNNDHKYLFLDEVVSHLDLKHQQQVLQIAKTLCENNVTVICILHDLNLALRYADRILFMKDGAICHEFIKGQTLSPEIIKEVFEVNVSILHDENSATPLLIFRP
jgi:iron complex transport system ATP-binding protein